MAKTARVWLSGDLHLGHSNLATKGYRPADADALTEKRHVLAVGPLDLWICLGDLYVGRHGRDALTALLDGMAGRKVLVRGNHDPESIHWYMRNGWDFACDAFDLDYGGKRILFTHEPRPRDVNSGWDLNVHGHLHTFAHRGFWDSEHYRLFSLETEKYKPVLLDTLLKRSDIRPKEAA